jgi:hypothetical protein
MRFEFGAHAFALKIIGYQFPNEVKDVDDMNWLFVEGHVGHPNGSWTFRDPCLMTGEVLRLATWLEDTAADMVVDVEQNFIEPNLSFSLRHIEDGKHIRVCFDLESRPAWAGAESRQNVWVEFPVNNVEVLAAAASLRQQLRRFPPRSNAS